MKIARLAGLVLVAMMTLGLTVASAAFAEPEFKPTGGTVKGISTTTNELVAGKNSITCAGNTTNSGTVSSATLLSGIVVTFTGCTSSGAEKSGCTANSTGASAGKINTATLHGVLGLILPKGTGSGVGLLLLPAVSKGVFAEIESNECTVETAVEGNVAAEWLLLLHIGNIIHLHFRKSGAVESIKDFDLSSGGLVLPALKAFGLTASQTTEEELDFTPGIEVT
jgi:hypothetical protein